jgi:hypothetical protein
MQPDTAVILAGCTQQMLYLNKHVSNVIDVAHVAALDTTTKQIIMICRLPRCDHAYYCNCTM